ncbi:MAG: phosphoribosyl-AMP cyclohydrolase, partial [Rhodothermales bacterium]
MSKNELLDSVKYDANGLVAALAQDHDTGEILMLAYMNADTLRRTLETNIMTYWSRSRQEVWVKGQS